MNIDVSKMIRNWGEWEVLHSLGTTKIKKVTINPGSEMSYHRHHHRTELWHIHQGEGLILVNFEENPDEYEDEEVTITAGKNLEIPAGVWHQIINVGKEPLVIIEMQYGEKCSEDDIERKG